ncbi:MAG: hypothetical protein ACOYLR_07410 [Chlorobium sp.]
MIAIRFNPDQLSDENDIQQWKVYCQKAKEATDQVIAEWEAWLKCRENNPIVDEFCPDFKGYIWRELKKWLFEKVFHNKCAYCESTLELDRYLGDVEHFRPKGQVTMKQDGKKRECVSVRIENKFKLNHPGYFWLAYEWQNLMPICSRCNSGAKADQFPTDTDCLLMVRLNSADLQSLISEPIVSKYYPDSYYLRPADLDNRERPLLLNPLNPRKGREPREHLRFGLGGLVTELDRSDLGKHSIDVLDLNRDTLCKWRQRAQEEVHRIYYSVFQDPSSDHQELLKKRLEKYCAGIEPYSGACLDYLEDIQEIQRRASISAIGRISQS